MADWSQSLKYSKMLQIWAFQFIVSADSFKIAFVEEFLRRMSHDHECPSALWVSGVFLSVISRYFLSQPAGHVCVFHKVLLADWWLVKVAQ